MTQAAARHILVSTVEACNDLKDQIENGASFEELAKNTKLSKWCAGRRFRSFWERSNGKRI